MEKLQSDNNLRFERKYNVDINKSYIFREILRQKKFFPIYNKRKVFSIYFDTHKFKFFRDNIEGVGNRIKVRLRWYENDKIDTKNLIKIALEIKKKTGFVGQKDNYKFGTYKNMDDVILDLKNINSFQKILKFIPFRVTPILVTMYDREYYQTLDKKFRSTIDTNLNVFSVKSKLFKIPILKEILEIKYNNTLDYEFRNKILTNNFVLRNQKFSKYVSGLIALKKNCLI